MGKDASEIRREIEETRARMGDTVEALGYKADVPARVKDAVNERVETVRGTIGDVVGTVKENLTGMTGRVGSALGIASINAADALGETGGKLGDATSTMRSNVQNTISNTVGSVSERMPNPDEIKNVARRGVGLAQENPLGLAIGAIAVGFLAGLAAPVSELERRTVGPIRDDLVERAKSAGSDALEHGKQVLQETAQAAFTAVQQSAQDHGQQVISEVRGETAHGQGQQQSQGGGGTSY
jgi:ElaB/YqjD/DUF883 family membrane-anchored ribosome-binding protein